MTSEARLKQLTRISDAIIKAADRRDEAHAQALDIIFDAGFRVCWEGRRGWTAHIGNDGRYRISSPATIGTQSATSLDVARKES